MITALTDANINATIADTPRLVVKFGTSWCAPCKTLDGILPALAEALPHTVVATMSLDESSKGLDYGVRAVPTTILFVNGTEVIRVNGAQPLQKMVDAFKVE